MNSQKLIAMSAVVFPVFRDVFTRNFFWFCEKLKDLNFYSQQRTAHKNVRVITICEDREGEKTSLCVKKLLEREAFKENRTYSIYQVITIFTKHNKSIKRILKEDGWPNVFLVEVINSEKEIEIIPVFISFSKQSKGKNWAMWFNKDGNFHEDIQPCRFHLFN